MDNVLPLRGALAAPLSIEFVRELSADDLKDLLNAPRTDVPVLKKLRAIHHRQAALLAEGKTNNEVAAICGTTPQRVVQLKQDPAFKDLMHYYEDQIITLQLEDSARLRDKAVDIGEMAMNEMAERLEDDAKRTALPMSELRQVAADMLNRTVLPPKATTNIVTAPQIITLDFGGKGFRNLDKAKDTPIIDVTPAKPKPEE